jgi:YD repeat-containing protein
MMAALSIGSTTHVWGYTFDATGRLTDVTKDGNAMSHYGYDADDNRTSYSGVRSAPRTTRKIACSRTALRATRTPPTASF